MKDLEGTLARYGYDITDEELGVLKNVQQQTAGMSDKGLLTKAVAGEVSRGEPVTLPPGPPLPVYAEQVLPDRGHHEVPHAGAEDRVSFRLACGRHGAELVRFLLSERACVFEVNRLNRRHRRVYDKDDPTGGEAAAGAVLADPATGRASGATSRRRARPALAEGRG